MAQTYTLTVNIEQGGTKTYEPNGTTSSSTAGHMWYSISDFSFPSSFDGNAYKH
ncbi:MAG: hypothetical protein QG567_300 [Campylobacterota bacterium]|nr:hypothetical protein [Campylobacterota bacterium]